MKYLLVFLVIAVAFHIWRSQRVRSAPPREQKKTLSKPEPMVHCDHCGVHLPQSDAISFRGRYFCSQEHLASAEPKP
jgi:uncharacterized protein